MIKFFLCFNVRFKLSKSSKMAKKFKNITLKAQHIQFICKEKVVFGITLI